MPGGSNVDKTWLVAVDDTGERELANVIAARQSNTGALLPVPADAIIYKNASLNSLVSI